jgi:ankyrin repeat protein
MKTHETYDPYELMLIPPNKKTGMIIEEIKSNEPNLNLISDLIVLGANLDWQGEENYNYTPLHVAAWFGRVEIVRMLIDAGADVNLQDTDGWAPLHWAAMRGQVEIARMLIGAGADKDVQDKWDQTPLHNATRNGDVEIVKMLIAVGARKDIEDKWGRIPYDLAETEEMKTILKP